ncbi:MAG: metallophosphoesterase family protein, partial [Gemmatimonadales bacterium]
DFDAVVLAGDNLYVASPVAIEAQIVAVATTIAHIAERARVFVCSGNHDLNALNTAGEKTADWLAGLRDAGVAVDGDSALIDGTLFTVIPWWDGPETQTMVGSILEEAARSRSGRWVWIYHAPPEGPLSWTGSRHYGDSVLPEWVDRYRPDVVLCGHIHQAPFTPDGSWVDRLGSCWLFNAGGKQMGPLPPFVEIDLDGSTARWVSLAGAEERALDELAPL